MIHSMAAKLTREFGERLFSAVFAGPVRECLLGSLDQAERHGAGLRLRIRLSDVPELNELPWEYLYDPSSGRFLALSSRTPVIRYVDLPDAVPPLSVAAPLSVLVVIPSPTDLPEVDVEREWTNVRESLEELVQRGLVEIELLTSATLPGLQRSLRASDHHVLHFIGYGGPDPDEGGSLLLEDESRRVKPVAGDYLGALLSDHRALRLVSLSACEGGRSSMPDPLGPVARDLVQRGIPAVVSMQFETTDEAARGFNREFYGALTDGSPVDVAITEARKAMFAEVGELEWATPVLYTRSRSGRIFDIAPPP